MTWQVTDTFATVVFVLFFKTIGTLLAQYFAAVAAGTDADKIDAQENETTYLADGRSKDEVVMNDRLWRRIVQNDLENIPIGILVFSASIMVNANHTINHICLWVFLAFRLAHTLTYAMRLQPHRSISWTFAAVAVGVSAIFGFIKIIF